MLTDEQKAEITMMMRVVNLLQNSQHIIGANDEMMDAYNQLKGTVGYMLDATSEEERNQLLEQYKWEADFLGFSKREE